MTVTVCVDGRPYLGLHFQNPEEVHCSIGEVLSSGGRDQDHEVRRFARIVYPVPAEQPLPAGIDRKPMPLPVGVECSARELRLVRNSAAGGWVLRDGSFRTSRRPMADLEKMCTALCEIIDFKAGVHDGCMVWTWPEITVLLDGVPVYVLTPAVRLPITADVRRVHAKKVEHEAA